MDSTAFSCWHTNIAAKLTFAGTGSNDMIEL